ncbi:MAG TPA: hypothetical protein VGQ63_06685 [Pseudolabrys sp.]|jgi:hypothetical protein|nr:hypothetical protein [Pseudolabrys sp.]
MNDVPLPKIGDSESNSPTRPEYWTASARTKAVYIIADLLPVAIVCALAYVAYLAITLFT